MQVRRGRGERGCNIGNRKGVGGEGGKIGNCLHIIIIYYKGSAPRATSAARGACARRIQLDVKGAERRGQ